MSHKNVPVYKNQKTDENIESASMSVLGAKGKKFNSSESVLCVNY